MIVAFLCVKIVFCVVLETKITKHYDNVVSILGSYIAMFQAIDSKAYKEFVK